MGLNRRLRPLEAANISRLPEFCQGCVFWETAEPLEVLCGSACDPEAARRWHLAISSEWGECGRVALEGDEVLGFIKYAPARFLPQSRNLPGAWLKDDDVLLACMHIRGEARNLGLGTLLLRAALKDIVSRGERAVYAYATTGTSFLERQPMAGANFLLHNGFTIVHPHPHYPLLRLELKSLAILTENFESVLSSLRIPLRQRLRMPSPSIEARGTQE